MSTSEPGQWVGMIARVRAPMRASTWPRSMLRVTGSQSTNTGVAPTFTIMLRTVKKLCAQVITSLPGPMPASCSAISTAAVAEVTTRTGRPPQNSDSAASKRSTQGPLVMWPERSTSPTAAIVASSIRGLANFRFRSGLIGLPVSALGDQPDAGDDEPDAQQALHADRLAEEVMRRDRVDHIAQRQHRVGDRHGDARQPEDPHHQAHDVEGDAADEMALGRHAHERPEPVVGGQGDDAEPVGAGLQQELRGGVE